MTSLPMAAAVRPIVATWCSLVGRVVGKDDKSRTRFHNDFLMAKEVIASD